MLREDGERSKTITIVKTIVGRNSTWESTGNGGNILNWTWVVTINYRKTTMGEELKGAGCEKMKFTSDGMSIARMDMSEKSGEARARLKLLIATTVLSGNTGIKLFMDFRKRDMACRIAIRRAALSTLGGTSTT